MNARGMKASHVLARLALACICVAFFLIALNGLFVSCQVETDFSFDNNEHVVFLKSNLLIILAVLVIGIAAFMLLLKVRITRRVNTVLTAIMVGTISALGIWWIACAKATPYADSLFLLQEAEHAASGNLTALASSDYLRKYPFQTGFLLYAELFVRLFGSAHVVAMQGMNIIFVGLAYLAVIRISRRLFHSDQIEFVTIILLMLCTQPVFLSTFIYGTLSGLALALWGAYAATRFLENRRWQWMLLAAILLAAATMLKKNYFIVAIAVVIVVLLDLLKNRAFRSLLSCAALILLCILGPILAQNSYESRAGAAFGKGLPQSAWLAMGLGESSMCSGWHNAQYPNDFSESGYDYAAADAEFSKLASERMQMFLSRPRYLGSFFYHKLTSQWNTPSFQSIWSSAAGPSAVLAAPSAQALYSGAGAYAIEAYFHWYTQLIYFGFAGAMALLFREKDQVDAMLILPLTVFGALLYHAAFEAKAQYALPYLVMMVPFCAYALTWLHTQFQRFHGAEAKQAGDGGGESCATK